MRRVLPALTVALALVAQPAGAITAFVIGTVTEFTFNGDETTPYPPALPSIAVGDAFQVTITYEPFPCGSPLSMCSHSQTAYLESISSVSMTVGGQTVHLGGGATHAGVRIENDMPGDRIDMSSPVLLNEGQMQVVLAGGVMPVATAFAYEPSGDLGALPGWDPSRSIFTYYYSGNPLYGTVMFSGAIDVAPIPEPATSLLVLAGLASFGSRRRRRA